MRLSPSHCGTPGPKTVFHPYLLVQIPNAANHSMMKNGENKHLVIGSHRLGDMPMSNESNTGLVNTHTKADCRRYDCHLKKH